jgi:plasmid stabilization system protein ParE
MSFILRPHAKSDMISIAKYIADHNPVASMNWYDEILSVCQMLGDA